jgi:phage FluMu protein Com
MSDNGQSPPAKPRDYRHHCGRLLFRGRLPAGTYIEMRCPRCNAMIPIKLSFDNTSILHLTDTVHVV